MHKYSYKLIILYFKFLLLLFKKTIPKNIPINKDIWYATTNKSKFEEVKRFIKKHEPSIQLKQLDKDIPEIQTLDQKAIALDKAKLAWEIIKEPILVDDSAMYFEPYNHFPGTMSKFVHQGIGLEGLLKLAPQGTKAYFLLHLVYIENSQEPQVFEGRCDGIIVEPHQAPFHPKLPYDAIFKPNGCDKTYAELRGTDEEHLFAYRLRAFKKFIEWFKNN